MKVGDLVWPDRHYRRNERVVRGRCYGAETPIPRTSSSYSTHICITTPTSFLVFFFFFLMIRHPPNSTLFPSPPLFRSGRPASGAYCFGPPAPKRLPEPAAGMTSQ